MDGAVEQPKHCWPCRASFADVTTIKKNRIYLRSQSVVGSVIPTIPARMTHSAPSEKSKHHDFFFFFPSGGGGGGNLFPAALQKSWHQSGSSSGISHTTGQEFTAQRERNAAENQKVFGINAFISKKKN